MKLGRCVRPIGSYRTFAGSTVKVAACVYNEQRMTFSKCSAWSNCRIVSHQRSSCGCWSGSQRCVKAGEMVECVHGDTVSHQLARVEVIVDGGCYWLEAAAV